MRIIAIMPLSPWLTVGSFFPPPRVDCCQGDFVCELAHCKAHQQKSYKAAAPGNDEGEGFIPRWGIVTGAAFLLPYGCALVVVFVPQCPWSRPPDMMSALPNHDQLPGVRSKAPQKCPKSPSLPQPQTYTTTPGIGQSVLV